MPKRPRRESKPTAPRSGTAGRSVSRPGQGRLPIVRTERPLLYKVVELSTVDEGALERTLNEWSQKGWNLDGVQFAMRESSKRPAMAFVFFTREGEALPPVAVPSDADAALHEEGARARLQRLSEHEDAAPPAPLRSTDPWQRLRELAEGGDEPDPEGGEDA